MFIVTILIWLKELIGEVLFLAIFKIIHVFKIQDIDSWEKKDTRYGGKS